MNQPQTALVPLTFLDQHRQPYRVSFMLPVPEGKDAEKTSEENQSFVNLIAQVYMDFFNGTDGTDSAG